ncbi:uncharacterized protein LOC142526181 [Primulina tabacum]|uniref:uncharacterized protein LOC142526181 n=1 Tax=Primulina tabacum TaxID=48773 RepID=UPI003F59F756
MPSGPKKRKAARKKKEKEHDDHSDPSSPAAHSHEVDEGKHQDDRERDVGELFPPALCHRSHRNLLSDGEEEEIEIEESCSTVPAVEALKIDDREGANIVIEDENAGEALLAPASHPENTSWKTCGGLFEVFARSDR